MEINNDSLNKNNKKIPKKIEKLIYQEANSACSICNENNINTLQIHHIYPRENNGSNDEYNLILVCSNCHSRITSGEIKQEEVMKKKIEIVKNNNQFDKNHSKKTDKTMNVNYSKNNGIIANEIKTETINLKINKKKDLKFNYPEGSIGSDLNKLNYIKHLIKRYHEFKKTDKTFNGKMEYSIIYKSIQRDFKCKWDLIPIEQFDNLANYLQSRIDNTILGKNYKSKGRKNFSSFNEFINDIYEK